jgi:hypothetical protein
VSMYRDPYTEEQLRFYRTLPPRLRPGMLQPPERPRRRRTRVTFDALALALFFSSIAFGFVYGMIGLGLWPLWRVLVFVGAFALIGCAAVSIALVVRAWWVGRRR